MVPRKYFIEKNRYPGVILAANDATVRKALEILATFGDQPYSDQLTVVNVRFGLISDRTVLGNLIDRGARDLGVTIPVLCDVITAIDLWWRE